MKRLISLACFLLLPSLALAQSITPISKNTTYKFCGSIYDATTAKRLTAAVTGIDCEYAQVVPASTDESAFADLSTAERVVGTVGQFCYTILNTEDNIDGEIRVSCKATNTNAADYERVFTTLPVPLVTLVTTTTTATTASTCSALTTNNDKTGYSLSGTQTFNVTGNITGNLSGSAGSVTGSVGSLGATAKSDVKTQVVAALSTDTYAELAACPTSTASITDILQFLFMDSRNKITATATAQKLKKNDGSTDLCSFSTSDDGITFTRGAGS